MCRKTTGMHPAITTSDSSLSLLENALARAGAGVVGQGAGGSEDGARAARAEPVEQFATTEHPRTAGTGRRR